MTRHQMTWLVGTRGQTLSPLVLLVLLLLLLMIIIIITIIIVIVPIPCWMDE